MVVGAGFEPAKAVLADLQSAPFGQLGYPTTSVTAVTAKEIILFKPPLVKGAWFIQ